MPLHLSPSSRRMLALSFIAPRPCRCGGCICLTPPERRALRRVGRIVRQWRRRVLSEQRAQGL